MLEVKGDGLGKRERHSLKIGTSSLASYLSFLAASFSAELCGKRILFSFPRLRPNSRNGARQVEELLGVSASALPKSLFVVSVLNLV